MKRDLADAWARPDAALRSRRARAAQALAGAGRRAQIGWDDLAAWPGWADRFIGVDVDAAARERLLWRVGAFCEAPALRRCIDGAVLKRLREGLGDADCTRLLQQPDAHQPQLGASLAPGNEPFEPGTLDQRLVAAGREGLLAAVPSAVLRLVLRERLWPATLPPVPAWPAAQAQRIVDAALHQSTEAAA